MSTFYIDPAEESEYAEECDASSATPVDDIPNRKQVNGHTLEMHGSDWKCLQCGHWFDGWTEAKAFFCGDPCIHPAATAPKVV